MKIARLGAFYVAISLIAQSGIAAAGPVVRASDSLAVSATAPAGGRVGAHASKSAESPLVGGTVLIGLISAGLSIGLLALISHHDKGSSN